MFWKKHFLSSLALFVSTGLLLCIMAFFSKSRRNVEMLNEEKEDGFKSEVDYMLELDKDVIFTDKADYKVAMESQNVIFNNGLTFIAPEDRLSQRPQENGAVAVESPDTLEPQGVQPVNQSSTDSTGSNSSDDEDSIDRNPVAEQYKDEVYGKVSPPTCNASTPQFNFVSIKTHRTGSSTLANILYRFGDMRNLTFLLPSASTYQYFWPLRFHISHAAVNLLNKDKPNMLVNAGRVLRARIKPLIHNNTKFIALLRDPVQHFESVYEYADVSRLIGLSNTTRDPFGTFLEAPKNNVIEFVQNSKSFAMELNLLKNGMAFDLGLDQQNFADYDAIKDFIDKLEKQIDLVMIAEYFDESLVLMKRIFCWKDEDIIYTRHRIRNSAFKNKVTNEQKEKIRRWNKADVMLYHHFNKTLWEKIGQQSEDFFEEVKEFRLKIAQVREVCFEEDHEAKSFELPLNLNKNIPDELEDLCSRLQLSEKEYIKLLKERQRERIKDSNLKTFEKRLYKDKNSSRIFYERNITVNLTTLDNSTFK